MTLKDYYHPLIYDLLDIYEKYEGMVFRGEMPESTETFERFMGLFQTFGVDTKNWERQRLSTSSVLRTKFWTNEELEELKRRLP